MLKYIATAGFCLLIAVAVCDFTPTAALADPQATVFPPANCATGVPALMSWTSGDTTTRCKTGQDVLKLALPNCAPNQQVVYNGSVFVCQNLPAVPPTCKTGTVLTFNNGAFQCVTASTSAPPTCVGSNKALQWTGSAFACASMDATANTTNNNTTTTNNDTTTNNTTTNVVPAYNQYTLNSSADFNNLMNAGMNHFGMTDWSSSCLIAGDSDQKLYSINPDCVHFLCWAEQGGSNPMPPYSIDAACVKGVENGCHADVFMYSFSCFTQ